MWETIEPLCKNQIIKEHCLNKKIYSKKKKKRLSAIDFNNVNVESEEPVKWRYTGSKIHVTYENAFKKGEKRNLIISYNIEKPVTGIFYGGPEEKYPNAPYYFISDCETERFTIFIYLFYFHFFILFFIFFF